MDWRNPEQASYSDSATRQKSKPVDFSWMSQIWKRKSISRELTPVNVNLKGRSQATRHRL